MRGRVAHQSSRGGHRFQRRGKPRHRLEVGELRCSGLRINPDRGEADRLVSDRDRDHPVISQLHRMIGLDVGQPRARPLVHTADRTRLGRRVEVDTGTRGILAVHVVQSGNHSPVGDVGGDFGRHRTQTGGCRPGGSQRKRREQPAEQRGHGRAAKHRRRRAGVLRRHARRRHTRRRCATWRCAT